MVVGKHGRKEIGDVGMGPNFTFETMWGTRKHIIGVKSINVLLVDIFCWICGHLKAW